jgi:hypothetical protein
MADKPEWKPAWSIAHINWDNCSVGFDCPCGQKELQLSEGGETHQCSCGRIYRLSVSFEMSEALILPPPVPGTVLRLVIPDDDPPEDDLHETWGADWATY